MNVTPTTTPQLVAVELLTATVLVDTGSGPGCSIQNDVGDLSSPNAVRARGAAQTTPE